MSIATPKTPRPPGLWRRMTSWLEGGADGGACHADGPPELRQAHALIQAVEAGGVPLNPARVNQIARALGLEVSTRAPVEDTIERIRQALLRAG